MSDFPLLSLKVVTPAEEQTVLPALAHLLQDAVSSGASVGFLPPLSHEDACAYWRSVFQEVAQETCILLIASTAEEVVGSVQLALAMKPNAQHRAEVQKLFVLQAQRRRGTGKALLAEIERRAIDHGRTLLVLDTRQGDAAEQLYRRVGYQEAGVIPAYARSATGSLDGTIFFYKQLSL